MNYPAIPREFFNGDCFDAYRILGAHPCSDNGTEGWRFAVWAPGATAVEVCGGFDGWEAGVPMEKADTGVWSAFVPGRAAGDLYKYRVHGAVGSVVMRSDPYAFSTELRPGTASILTKLDFAFDDDSWMQRRDKCRNLPLNIYELHAGSWKHTPNSTREDGSDGWYNYRELARELIPWLLGRCASVQQARTELSRLNLTGTPFSAALPAAQLHWLIADEREAVTVESTADGLHVYENPIGVLTNNPPFGEQLFNLNNYMHLSPRQPENRFSQALPLRPYSRGMGALGLPGDLSSMSRFVRAAFTKLNAVSDDTEQGSVSQFFHILGAVEQQRGCCEVADGQYERTIYTSCCNAHSGVYYYSTYDNRCLTAVDLHRENLDGSALIAYPLITEQQILWQNRR